MGLISEQAEPIGSASDWTDPPRGPSADRVVSGDCGLNICFPQAMSRVLRRHLERGCPYAVRIGP